MERGARSSDGRRAGRAHLRGGEFVRADVALRSRGTGHAALIGRRAIGAGGRDLIDRRAARLQRHRPRRAAVVLERSEVRIATREAARTRGIAGGEVVPSVGDRRRAAVAASVEREQAVLDAEHGGGQARETAAGARAAGIARRTRGRAGAAGPGRARLTDLVADDGDVQQLGARRAARRDTAPRAAVAPVRAVPAGAAASDAEAAGAACTAVTGRVRGDRGVPQTQRTGGAPDSAARRAGAARPAGAPGPASGVGRPSAGAAAAPGAAGVAPDR